MVKQSEYIGKPKQEFLIGAATFQITGSSTQSEQAINIYASTTLSPVTRMSEDAGGGSSAIADITRAGGDLYILRADSNTAQKTVGISGGHDGSTFAVPVSTSRITNDGTNLISYSGSTVSVHDGFTATIASTFTLADQSEIHVHKGNLYGVTHSGTDFTITKYVGISSTVDTSITITYTGTGVSLPSICFMGDDLVTLVFTLPGGVNLTTYRYQGFSTTLLSQYQIGFVASGSGKAPWVPASIIESMRKQGDVIL